MAVTDILDDLGGASIQEVLVAEAPPPGRALSTLTADDLTKLSALHFAPITARRCEVEREQARVLMRIKEAAAMASNEFYYSFPVKKKGGGTDYIEGISIDGAMACLQAYGNAEIDCRPIDIGHSWIFLARFIDHERGTSVIRPFLQRKVGGSRLGGEDEGRRLEIAFNIGAPAMSWHSTGRFTCDGCKLIETADIVIEADIFQPVPPAGWLRVETHRPLHDLDVQAIRHYCPSCAPLIESYLSGAKATA